MLHHGKKHCVRWFWGGIKEECVWYVYECILNIAGVLNYCTLRHMQQWRYNTTHILNLDKHVGVVQPHVAATYSTNIFPCVRRTEDWVDLKAVLMLRGERFSTLQGIQLRLQGKQNGGKNVYIYKYIRMEFA